jgi:hypothetical protein
MTEPYPIISQRTLMEPPRRGPFKMGSPRRPDNEMPTLHPHEVLVYRIGSKYIVDDGQRGSDHSQVVNASSVSVVNMRRGADVSVSFEIVSKDATIFTVQVNFTCSVIDPVTVVRDGQTNASESLLAYLKGYQPLFELGLMHPLAEINVVRRKAGLHVKAYMTMCPPGIPGMSIELANVQVMTPQELAEVEERHRKEEMEQRLATERMQREHDLERQRQEGERALKEQQQEADHSLRQQQQTSDQTFNLKQQQGDHMMKLLHQENEHLLGVRDQQRKIEEFESYNNILEGNPRQIHLMAHIRGEISADELARRLRELNEEDRRQAWAVIEAERLAEEKATEMERADAREKAALDREVAKEAAALKRADTMRELEWEREDRRDNTAYDRAKAEREAKEARDVRQQEIEVELEILREFNKRGLLDNYYPDINGMMRRIRGEPITEDGTAARLHSAEEPPELPPPSTDEANPEMEDDDLREEDGD